MDTEGPYQPAYLYSLAQLIGSSINQSIKSTKMIFVSDLQIIDYSISVGVTFHTYPKDSNTSTIYHSCFKI